MCVCGGGGGHVNFHVSRGGGVTINFDFPAGGSCLNCSNKITLKKSSLALLAHV